MIELVEKLGYDVESTIKFISEHNEKVLKYWTSGLKILLLLIAIIAGYFIYKKVTDDITSFFLFMILIMSCLLLYEIIPKYVFKPMLTEEKQTVQKKYKDVKNNDIDTSKYEVRFSKDRKYLVLDNKGNDIKFMYDAQKDGMGIKQPKDMLHVVDETDKEYLVEAQYFNAPEPVRTEVVKVPKDTFKVTE
jgi:hypothetical protein